MIQNGTAACGRIWWKRQPCIAGRRQHTCRRVTRTGMKVWIRSALFIISPAKHWSIKRTSVNCSASDLVKMSVEQRTLDCKDLHSYLKTLPAGTLDRLYNHPATCLAAFRELPELCRHYIMRILFVDQAVPKAIMGSWVSSNNTKYYTWLSHLSGLVNSNVCNVFSFKGTRGGCQIVEWIAYLACQRNARRAWGLAS